MENFSDQYENNVFDLYKTDRFLFAETFEDLLSLYLEAYRNLENKQNLSKEFVLFWNKKFSNIKIHKSTVGKLFLNRSLFETGPLSNKGTTKQIQICDNLLFIGENGVVTLLYPNGSEVLNLFVDYFNENNIFDNQILKETAYKNYLISEYGFLLKIKKTGSKEWVKFMKKSSPSFQFRVEQAVIFETSSMLTYKAFINDIKSGQVKYLDPNKVNNHFTTLQYIAPLTIKQEQELLKTTKKVKLTKEQLQEEKERGRLECEEINRIAEEKRNQQDEDLD